MTVSTSSSPPGPTGPREPRHRAIGGRGSTGRPSAVEGDRDTDPQGALPAPRRAGRHRAPDAPPSGGFTIVPGPRDGGSGEPVDDGPGAGFRPLPPPGFAATPPGVSSIGVPLGAVPTQREPAVPRRRPAHPTPGAVPASPGAGHGGPAAGRPRPTPMPDDAVTVPDDEAVTVPVRSDALDRAASRGPAGHATVVDTPALRPLSVQRPEAMASPHRFEARHESPSRAAPTPRGRLWETPPVDQASSRLGLVALVTGVLGVLVGLAPWSGLLPRVLPQSALGAIPVFNLVGALLGVTGLGIGAVAMLRASETSRGLLVGVVGACVGAAAVVVGLIV